MDAFLETISTFPTILFTGLLGLTVVYWFTVVIGALDIDILGGGDGLLDGAADGAAEGIAEGIAEGAAEGIAEGAAEGIAEGAAEGVAEGAAEGATEGAAEGAGSALGGFIHAFKLRSAPVTVVASLIIFFGWVISYLSMRTVGVALASSVPAWLTGTLVLFVGTFLALVLTSIAVRPLAPIFKPHHAPTRRDILGKTCTIRTGSVDARFGQAVFQTGGATQLIDVRCDDPNQLKKGKEALLIDFDDERQAYLVEPMDPLLKLPPSNNEA